MRGRHSEEWGEEGGVHHRRGSIPGVVEGMNQIGNGVPWFIPVSLSVRSWVLLDIVVLFVGDWKWKWGALVHPRVPGLQDNTNQ